MLTAVVGRNHDSMPFRLGRSVQHLPPNFELQILEATAANKQLLLRVILRLFFIRPVFTDRRAVRLPPVPRFLSGVRLIAYSSAG